MPPPYWTAAKTEKKKSSAGTKLALSDQFSDAYVGRHKHATGIDLSGTVYIITQLWKNAIGLAKKIIISFFKNILILTFSNEIV